MLVLRGLHQAALSLVGCRVDRPLEPRSLHLRPVSGLENAGWKMLRPDAGGKMHSVLGLQGYLAYHCDLPRTTLGP